MHQNDRGIKQGDRLLKMQGKLDRGPVEFKSHIAEQEGEIMAIATTRRHFRPPYPEYYRGGRDDDLLRFPPLTRY